MIRYFVVGRRSDPSAPAGLQQQPVLLWCLNPRATGDGETGQLLHPPHPQLRSYAKIQFNFSLVFLQDPLEQKYPNVSVQALSLMKVKIPKIHSQIISANICRTVSTFMFNIWRGGILYIKYIFKNRTQEVQMLQFCCSCCFDGFHGFLRSGLSEDGPVRAADLRAAAAAPVLRQPEGKEREQLPGAGPRQEDALPTETPSSRGKFIFWVTHDIHQYYLQKPHNYPFL